MLFLHLLLLVLHRYKLDDSKPSNLHLETIGSSATTSTLELASLGDGSWLDTIVSVWVVDRSSVTKVLDGFTNALAATE